MVRFNYVVSRTVDPLLGVGVGVLGFFLSEKKENRPEGHRLKDLIVKRWNKQI